MPDTQIVILPGLDGEGAYMQPFLAACAGKLQASLLTLPRDLHNYEQGARALLPLLPQTPFYIVAESFAGPLALHIAAHAPSHLRGLVLSASFTRPPMPHLLLEGLAHTLPYLHNEATRYLARCLLANDGDSELAGMAIRSFAALPKDIQKKRIQSVARVEADGLLESCNVPVLILKPSHDRLLWHDYPEILPEHVRQEIIEAPHMLLAQAAEIIVEKIMEFASENGVISPSLRSCHPVFMTGSPSAC